jgi:5-methylcytosine-specific restriction protein B
VFDKFRLKDVLVDYKKDFVSTEWGNEKYKWEAIRCFQDNWDVNAQDFADMLHRSLDKTFNLLASMNNFPRRMIEVFAKTAPEEIRAMFIALYDESKDIYDRIKGFKDQASIMLEKYGNGAAQHYQYENAISVYLWLRYPDKYYIYKYGEIKTTADELNSDYTFKKGAYADNIRGTIKFYDEICDELKLDTELVNLFRSQLTETCYPDPELKTLTIDVGFYVSRYYSQKNSGETPTLPGEWFPEDYEPGLTVDDWVALLGDKDVFTENSLEIMRRMKDYGGQATCTQLAIKYGETKNFYNSGSVGLARRIVEKTGCPVMERNNENARWWTILYVGKSSSKDEEGSYIWKLRDELSEALDKVDLSQVQLYATPESGDDDHHYWWLNANPKIWSFSGIAVGEVQDYTLYNENGNKRRIFQNFLDAKPGDMVIGYESYPVKQIVALAKISAEQDGEKLYFEKTEGLTSPIDYQTLKSCPELEKMEYFVNPQGSLCMIDFDNFKQLNDQYGHLFGDKVLKKFSDIAHRHIRKGDVLGRYGGEEFVFIFDGIDEKQSFQILKRIHVELTKYFSEIAKQPVTFSAGIVAVDSSSQTMSYKELLGQADSLLYEAKELGRSRAMGRQESGLFIE